MRTPTSRTLSPSEIDAFGAELDALKKRVLDDLGERDARYIRRIRGAVRWTGLGGRTLLFAGVLPPAWVAGTLLLGVSKILENMELGHNVLHGQYDWMHDPEFLIARKYGQHYETGPLLRQFSTVVRRIFRHSLPSKPRSKGRRPSAESTTLEAPAAVLVA